jgi:DNA-binding NtrC family response regulator
VAKILVADDEHGICAAFAEFLKREGHDPVLASTGDEALQLVAAECPAMVFLDVQMPGLTGLEVLGRLKESHPDLPVVVMTAFGTMDTAMQAVQQGAFDYIGKPVELAQVRKLLQRGLHKQQVSPHSTLDENAAEETQALVGQSAAMQEIFKLISLLTNNDMTVLVMGETGVGKEVVARAIHQHSTRRARPFVSVNCAAIVENLAESELFGHEKGSFTGADARRVGRFEAAADGTLFLDEVSELPLHMQSKLLRVLQERVYEPVGSVKEKRVEARLIAASNRDLLDLVEKGEFREDLYHRLNLVALRIPPLRQRQSDIPLLADHFLRQIQVELNKTINGIEPAALQRLQSYSWPGNVREMEHCLKRAALMAPGSTLTEHDLDLPQEAESGGNAEVAGGMLGLADAARQAFRELVQAEAEGPDAGRPDLFHSLVGLVERVLVEEALERSGDNQVAAARVLGLHRTTLRKKLEQAGAGGAAQEE